MTEPTEPAEPIEPAEPAEPPEATTQGIAFSSMDAAGLLVHALGQLPPADRDKVYIWLLGTSVQLPPGLASQLGGQFTRAARPATQQDFTDAGAEVVHNLFRSPGPGAQQVVPVRFSAEQHARLRAWCTEHGFSMATVIRGLVDRFLDGQQAAAG